MSGSTRSGLTDPLPPTPTPSSGSQEHKLTSADPEGYIPLEECVSGYSGTKKPVPVSRPRAGSSPSSPLDKVPPPPGTHMDSIPDTAPPPPPSKAGQGDSTSLEHSMMYDHPPRSYINQETIEKHGSNYPMEVYDYPKQSYRDTAKLDANENFYKTARSVDAFAEDDGVYNVPPNHDDLYRVPPSHEDVYKVPPSHPREESVYKVPPPRARGPEDSVYNVPPPRPAPIDTMYSTPPLPRSTDSNDLYKTPSTSFQDSDDLYQTPPSSRIIEDEGFYQSAPHRGGVYKMPTSHSQPLELAQRSLDHRTTAPSMYHQDSVYTVPPAPKALNVPTETMMRDSNSSNGSHASHNPLSDSGFESGDPREVYDTPPRRQLQSDSQSVEGLSSQVHSASIRGPPSPRRPQQNKARSEDNLMESVPPPPRPPRSDLPTATRDSQYINLRNGNPPAPPPVIERDRASTLPSNKHVTVTEDSYYDFPRSQQPQQHVQFSDNQKMTMTPPPPQGCASKPHRYINAPTGYTSSEPDNIYLPMEGRMGEEEMYLPMQPSVSRAPQTQAVSFTDLDNVYVSPPSSSRQPVSRSCSDIVPAPRMQPWKQKLLAGVCFLEQFTFLLLGL